MYSLEDRKSSEKSGGEAEDPRWNRLYTLGGAAALMIAGLISIHIIVFIANPPPSTVIGWFTLFQEKRLVALIDMDLLFIIVNALLILVYLALYAALRRVNESFMAIALALGLVAIATLFASNTAFGMLSLSDQYATAATDVERSVIVAAGQAMLTTYTGTAFHVSYILGSIAGIVIGAVMFQSSIFSKATAYTVIIGNAIGFGLYVPVIGLFFGVISGPILWIWFILIARRFFQLGRGGPAKQEKRSIS